jgi:hypothetical protein
MKRIFLLTALLSLLYTPLAFSADPSPEMLALKQKLSAHFESNGVNLEADATEIGALEDKTPFIKMFTKELMTFLVLVYSAEADAKRDLEASKERREGDKEDKGFSFAQNKNLLMMVIPMPEENNDKTKGVVEIFSKYNAK